MPNTVKKTKTTTTSPSTFKLHHTTNKSLLAQHKKLAPLIHTLFSPHSPFITCRALDPLNPTIDPTTSVALAPGSIAMLFSAEDYATYLPALSYVMPPSSINNKPPAGVNNKPPAGVNNKPPAGVNNKPPAGVKLVAQTSEYVYLILEHPYLFLIK